MKTKAMAAMQPIAIVTCSNLIQTVVVSVVTTVSVSVGLSGVTGSDEVRWEGAWTEWSWFAGAGGVNGSRYRVSERTSTYHAAQQRCLQLGAYLARIDTVREQVFVEDFLRHVLRSLVARDGQ